MTQQVGSDGPDRGIAVFLLGLALALLCAAYATHAKLAALDAWRADPAAHFADGVPAMTTTDAYYALRWAEAWRTGRFAPQADDPLRHYQRLQYPLGTSEAFPGDAPLDWWPQRQPRRLPLLSGLLGVTAPLAGGVEWAGVYLVPILASLFVLPLFLYAWRIGAPAAGILGGLVGAFAPVYFARTQPGYVDTDCLNLFFPWAAALAIACIDRRTRPWTLIAIAALLGGVLHLYYLWYDKAALAAMFWATLTLHLVVQRRRPQEVLLALAVCVVCSHPIQAALGLGNALSLLQRYAGHATPADGLAATHAMFPDVMTTVAELQGGRGLGAFKEVLGRPEPAVLGVLAFAVFAVARWRECVPLLPLLVMAGFAFVGGSRFTMFLAPFVGLGLGLLIVAVTGRTLAWVAARRGDGTATGHRLGHAALGYALVLLAFWAWLGPLAARHVPATNLSLPASAIRALHALRERLPPGTPAWTWWDHGFALAHVAGLAVYHDGGAQYLPQTHAIAWSLMDDDPSRLHAVMGNVERLGNRGIATLAGEAGNREALLAALAQPAPAGAAGREQILVFTRNMFEAAAALRYLAGLPMRDARGGQETVEPLPCTGMDRNRLHCRGLEFDLDAGRGADGRRIRRLDIVDNGSVVRRVDYPNDTGTVMQMLIGPDRRIETFLVSDGIYRSNLNRMFVLGEYDHERFEEVMREVPVLRVFRRKAAVAARDR